MHPVDLETLVHGQLRQLPVPRAPATLLPRVLAAVQEWAERPWYARAWFTWPLGWQVAMVAALIVIVAGSAALLQKIPAASTTHAADVMSVVAGIVERVEVATHAASILWRALLEPFVAYAFAVVVLMSVACAAFGAALNRVVLGGAFPR